jgi:hypothetical protein
VEFDVEAACSESRKCRTVAENSPISCHPPRLGGAGVVELTAFFGLSKRPASGSVLLAQPPPSISALKVLESSSPRRAVGSSTQCKKT